MSLAEAADIVEPIRASMAETEQELAQLFDADTPAIEALSEHVQRFSGKRLRPMLVHLCGGMVGERSHEHAKIGAFIETLHMASLMHDDVLDEADTRRQVTTLNSLYGNQVPILMGDLVFARAFSLSLALSRPEGARTLAHASEAICLGEIEQSFLRYTREYDEGAYFKVIQLKTAVLFGAACKLGALYAGGNDEQVEALKEFGENLGMAFQIIDDCLDVVGDERIVGKSLGTDLETGKVTLPIIRLADTLDEADQDRLRDVLYGEVAGRRRDVLAETFEIAPIVERCQAEADAYLQRCRDILDGFDDCAEHQSLAGLLGFVIARRH